MSTRHERSGYGGEERDAVLSNAIDRLVHEPTRDDALDRDSVDAFCHHLIGLQPQADDTFRHQLEQRIRVAWHERQAPPVAGLRDHSSGLAQWRPAKWWKAGLVGVGALLFSLIIVGPVLGQVPPWRNSLKHVTVHEVGMLPAPNRVAEDTPMATKRWATIDELRQQAGFVPLFPTYLPTGCTAQERWYATDSHELSLVYSCAIIAEQSAAAGHQDPTIKEGTAQSLTIHGVPAVYVEGAWVGHADSPPVWVNNGMGMIIFEFNGLIIRVTGHRPKETLTKIAETIR